MSAGRVLKRFTDDEVTRETKILGVSGHPRHPQCSRSTDNQADGVFAAKWNKINVLATRFTEDNAQLCYLYDELLEFGGHIRDRSARGCRWRNWFVSPTFCSYNSFLDFRLIAVMYVCPNDTVL